MKKVLLATTALVASAGFAAADVKISGSAEMGVVGGSNMESQFHQDIDVTFSMSGETDGGMQFGASVNLSEAAVDTCTTTVTDTDADADGQADAGGTTASTSCTEQAMGDTSEDGGIAVWMAYGGLTVTLGDTDGGFDAAMSEVGAGGAIADDHTSHAGYNGNSGLDGTYDGQILSAKYAVADFTVIASVEVDETGTSGNDPVIGIGGAWSGSAGDTSIGIGVGYQTTSTAAAGDLEQFAGASISVGLDNGLSLVGNYSSATGSGTGTQTHWALGVAYTMNQITVAANYGEYENAGGVATDDQSGWGAAIDYDLGGGAEVQFGYGQSSYATGHSNGLGGSTVSTWSLGIAMSF